MTQDFVLCPDCENLYDPALPTSHVCRRLDEEPKRPLGSLWHGVALLGCLHLLQLVWLPNDALLIWFTGITQVVYAVPAMIVLAVQRKWHTLLGVFLCGALTLTVNLVLASLMCGGGSW